MAGTGKNAKPMNDARVGARQHTFPLKSMPLLGRYFKVEYLKIVAYLRLGHCKPAKTIGLPSRGEPIEILIPGKAFCCHTA